MRLHGELACIGCGYSLKGLSISSTCPECGIAVRATLLAVVDPKAAELGSVRHPSLSALGLVLWGAGALVAALAVWIMRAADLATVAMSARFDAGWAPLVALVGVLASALGAAFALVKPYETTRDKDKLAAIGAVLAYGPLALIMWKIHAQIDPMVGMPYFADPPSASRLALRLASGVLMAVIVIGLRPNALALAERSLIFRSGRVDRQSMLALLGAMGVAATGDVMMLFTGDAPSGVSNIAVYAATAFVGLGSMLLTIGLWGVFVDTLRLHAVVRRRPVGLADVLADGSRREPSAAINTGGSRETHGVNRTEDIGAGGLGKSAATQDPT